MKKYSKKLITIAILDIVVLTIVYIVAAKILHFSSETNIMVHTIRHGISLVILANIALLKIGISGRKDSVK